jgi:thiamine-phosphate pyrophosphorylase
MMGMTMGMTGPGFFIYLITERRLADRMGGLTRAVEGALAGGIKGVQLREKDLEGRDLFELALELRELTYRYGARLLINDRVDIAMAADADGVHLGQNGLPPGEARRLLGRKKLIGVSTHSFEEALEAQRQGADFITLGPVYSTPSKAQYGEPIGLGPLNEASRALKIPVLAIGGIKKERLKEVVSSGAFGVAVISAVLGAGDARKNTEEIVRELNLSRRDRKEGMGLSGL